jgi:hypothetical protein
VLLFQGIEEILPTHGLVRAGSIMIGYHLFGGRSQGILARCPQFEPLIDLLLAYEEGRVSQLAIQAPIRIRTAVDAKHTILYGSVWLMML